MSHKIHGWFLETNDTWYPFATYFWDDFSFSKGGSVVIVRWRVIFFFPCEPESIVMFVLRGNPSNMTWNSRQPMTVRWAIQLRSLFHEQQQYVGVSHPGGTCKIWCYETRNADDWKPQQKTDWKKTTRVVFHCHYPLLKTSTFVENWWLEDEISLEMVTFQVTCWFFWGWYNQLLRCVSHEPRKTPGSRCPPNSQGEKVGEVPEEEGSWPRDSIFVARV